MNILYLAPGAGKMYCGNCLRDNALAAALHRQGHNVCIVPLYLPATLDTSEADADEPIFFSGINVYLDHKVPLFRYVPRFVRRWFASRRLLRYIGSFAARTQPSQVGGLTVSMLQGEHGRQVEDLNELCRWLQNETPSQDVIVFSNAMLLGMHNRISQILPNAKTVCFLSGEDTFLDALREPFRSQAWDLTRKYAAAVHYLFAPSRYYADNMSRRLGLPGERIQILPPGICLEGYENKIENKTQSVPVLGYFARMCRAKGLDVLVDAFMEVRRRNAFPNLKLKVGGGLMKPDEPFVKSLKQKIRAAGFEKDAEFFPNVSREDKIAFLNSLTIFSVPSRLNEPFGLYVLESHSAGVPVLFPNRGAFPEIIGLAQSGLLFEPEDFRSLADAIEKLLGDELLRQTLGQNARKAATDFFDIELCAKRFVESVGAPTGIF